MKEDYIVFYDGVCALCNFFVKWVIAIDKKREFFFCPQQSQRAKEILTLVDNKAVNALPGQLQTVIVYRQSTNEIFIRSKAFFEVCSKVGYPYNLLTVFSYLPNFLTDFVYNLIAKYRYKVFGIYDTCPMPDPKDRDRFLLD